MHDPKLEGRWPKMVVEVLFFPEGQPFGEEFEMIVPSWDSLSITQRNGEPVLLMTAYDGSPRKKLKVVCHTSNNPFQLSSEYQIFLGTCVVGEVDYSYFACSPQSL